MEQAKKECILHAAARAFARFGFKKASVEEIAKDAGVAKGTVYLACDTKEDLFYQAVHREVRSWSAEIAKMIDPRIAADELLLKAAIAGLQYMQERPLVRQLLFGDYHLLLPEWTARMDELRDLARANAIEILRLGIKQGRFRAELDVEEVSTILQDVMITTHLFYNRGAEDEPRLARRMAVSFDLLMNGIRQPPVAHAAPPVDDKAQKPEAKGSRHVRA